MSSSSSSSSSQQETLSQQPETIDLAEKETPKKRKSEVSSAVKKPRKKTRENITSILEQLKKGMSKEEKVELIASKLPDDTQKLFTYQSALNASVDYKKENTQTGLDLRKVLETVAELKNDGVLTEFDEKMMETLCKDIKRGINVNLDNVRLFESIVNTLWDAIQLWSKYRSIQDESLINEVILSKVFKTGFFAEKDSGGEDEEEEEEE